MTPMQHRHDYDAADPGDADYAEGLREAIGMFERGEYWETHEALERIWLHQHGVEKHFLAGFIQLACAIYKTRQGNPRAGRRIFARALAHLAWVDGIFRGIDIRGLETECHKALKDEELFPVVGMIE